MGVGRGVVGGEGARSRGLGCSYHTRSLTRTHTHKHTNVPQNTHTTHTNTQPDDGAQRGLVLRDRVPAVCHHRRAALCTAHAVAERRHPGPAVPPRAAARGRREQQPAGAQHARDLLCVGAHKLVPRRRAVRVARQARDVLLRAACCVCCCCCARFFFSRRALRTGHTHTHTQRPYPQRPHPHPHNNNNNTHKPNTQHNATASCACWSKTQRCGRPSSASRSPSRPTTF